MRMPVGLNVALLVVASTAFYTYVGQLVPQKEIQPPAQVALKKEMTPSELAAIGRKIADGKGLCLTCHTIGKSGALRFPDLAGVANRAGHRVEGLSALEYFAQTLYEPNAFIVPGFNPGMPTINKAPIGLTDEEIIAVIAWLQSLGGEPTVTLDTTHAYRPSAS